jgi:hypothetical protein
MSPLPLFKMRSAWYITTGAGDDVYFNKRFSEFIRMLQNETTYTREDSLYDEYCSQLPAGIADHIIALAHM